MSWHNDCDSFDSRIEASAKDANFNDTEFLLIQDDATNPSGDKVSANKAVLALISPVFYAQFYGPLSTTQPPPIEDGTARGFKQLINFIYNPTSFSLPVDNVVEVFEISYFAHKYQIGSLVSKCRDLLDKFDVEGKELETLRWVVSTELGGSFKETLKAEYELLVNRCWKQTEQKFEKIFPNGEIRSGQDLLDEHLMLKILSNKHLDTDESFILRVTLDYYSKLIENGQDVVQNKKMKMDNEIKWNEKLATIKSIIKFDKVYPKKFGELVEKIVGKVPHNIMECITVSISSSWKNLASSSRFSEDAGKRSRTDREIHFDFKCKFKDCIHDNQLGSGVSITFKTNQDAILYFNSLSLMFNRCIEVVCGNDEVDCCVEDKIVFTNEGHSKDEFAYRRTKQRSTVYERHFYVEANKNATLHYERKCKKSSCPLHLLRMDKFLFAKDNFEVEILEVNGQPVSTPCYSFLNFLFFIPVNYVKNASNS